MTRDSQKYVTVNPHAVLWNDHGGETRLSFDMRLNFPPILSMPMPIGGNVRDSDPGRRVENFRNLLTRNLKQMKIADGGTAGEFYYPDFKKGKLSAQSYKVFVSTTDQGTIAHLLSLFPKENVEIRNGLKREDFKYPSFLPLLNHKPVTLAGLEETINSGLTSAMGSNTGRRL